MLLYLCSQDACSLGNCLCRFYNDVRSLNSTRLIVLYPPPCFYLMFCCDFILWGHFSHCLIACADSILGSLFWLLFWIFNYSLCGDLLQEPGDHSIWLFNWDQYDCSVLFQTCASQTFFGFNEIAVYFSGRHRYFAPDKLNWLVRKRRIRDKTGINKGALQFSRESVYELVHIPKRDKSIFKNCNVHNALGGKLQFIHLNA